MLASSGKVIFPVAEPFGSHLEKAIGNPVIAENYISRAIRLHPGCSPAARPQKQVYHLR